MSRARAPVFLAALLAASASAGVGVWKRFTQKEEPEEPAHQLVLWATASPAPSASASALPALDPTREPKGPSRMARGDAARRNRSAYRGPSQPEVLYRFAAGSPIETAPVVFEDGSIAFGTLGGLFLKLDAEGRSSFSVDLAERIYGSPLLLGEQLVVGSDARRITALSAATGKRRWSLDVDGEADSGAADLPGGDLVVAAGNVVYAVRPDGGVRWRLKAKKKIYAAPAVAPDGTVYVGSQDRHLYAISKTGSLLWRKNLGGDVDCAASIGENGLIYVGSDKKRVVAFDAEGGVRFDVAVGGFVRGGLTVTRRGDVLVGTYGPAPRVVALDGETGAERWSFGIQGTGADEFGIHGAPLEDPDENLYFGAHDNAVYSLDARGKLRWTFRTEGDVDAPLTIGPQGVLYVPSDDGTLHALRDPAPERAGGGG